MTHVLRAYRTYNPTVRFLKYIVILIILSKVVTLDFVWEFIREYNEMEWNNHKGMKWNWMYLSKENEWNGVELSKLDWMF